ncbi:MAG: DUF5698 domain-containing protein [Gemmatimonadota bacterium]|nr:DUF5698 domain-containing protein [Gemmatimonadota bacterium]
MLELLSGPWGPLAIFGLRVADVSLGTIRFMLITRDARLGASLAGVVEVLIWIMAVGAAVQNLDSPWHLLGYAGGFGTGTAVGMWLEGKLAIGTTSVNAFSRVPDANLADRLRDLGYRVTESRGEGRDGLVDIVSTIVRRRDVPRLLETIETTDPGAFIALYDAKIHRRRGKRP